MCGVCLVLMVPGPRKPSDVYAVAIAKYVAGDPDAAVQALSRVSPADMRSEIERSVTAIQSNGGSDAADRRLEVIALLHTEYALSGHVDPKNAPTQIEMAHRSLTIWTQTLEGKIPDARPDQAQRAREFLRRWSPLAAGVLLFYSADRDARTIVDQALTFLPDDESLLYWRGFVREFQAVWVGVSAVNPQAASARVGVPGSDPSSSMPTWGPVEEAYRRALQRDQSDYQTHLHLGYALYSQGRDGPAATEYELARDQSSDPFVVYVADLLLARMKEDQSDPAGAAQDYEHALAKMPNAQSAYVGLSLLEARRGNSQRASELTLRLAAIPEEQRSRDPWWAFHTSRVPIDDLHWLRAAVRQ